MAKRKKSRTPAPPRRPARPSSPAARTGDGKGRQVQAPKVRTGKRRTEAEQERRARLILYGLALSGVLGLVIALVVVFAFRGGGGNSTSIAHDDGPNVNFAKLIGVRTSKGPWSSGLSGLEQRLQPIGLHPLGQEGQVLHLHEHLDIFVNGKQFKVASAIGYDQAKNFIAELHTHSTDGVIHLESPEAHTFSLGQFFGVWGVFLSKKCIGGDCGNTSRPLRFYVNGKLFAGNPVKLVLQKHQEIAVVYGKSPDHIPSSYDWQPGE